MKINMKKLLFFLLICLLVIPVYSNEVTWDDLEDDPSKKLSRIPNRIFEYEFLLNTGFSNNFFTVNDILKEEVIIEIDKLFKGFMFNFDLNITPVYFKFNSKNKWGWGLFVNTDTIGIFNFSGDMLTFKEKINSQSEVNGALFAQAGLDFYFHLQDYKVKIKPAVYYPFVYMRSDIYYTFNNIDDGTILDINYNICIYTPFPIDSFDSLPSNFRPTVSPGFDFCVSIEYPMSRAMGINSKPLDFDIGIDIINIPIYPSTMRNYMKMSGGIGSSDPINVFDDGFDTLFSSIDFGEAEYGEGEEIVERPFKLHIWAFWRPFETPVFAVIPLAGFSINPFYANPFYIEGGVTVKLDFLNFFIVDVGTNYIDRIWKNSAGITLNLRAIEINLCIDMRSQDFLKSWTAGGLGFDLGLKFGW